MYFFTSVFLVIISRNILLVKCQRNLDVEYQWSSINYAYESEFDRQNDIRNGNFRKGQAVPIDVDVFYRNLTRYVFVTTPRFRDGIPATLGYVMDDGSHTNPTIIPYFGQMQKDFDKCYHYRIVSVYRIFIDKLSRLWVLDTGIVNQIQYCSPQILVFDLIKDQLIHKYEIPDQLYRKNYSILVSPIVEIQNNSHDFRNTYVYIADITAYGLIVYDVFNNVSWRVEHNFFYPNPDFGHFIINGESFDLMDGIISMVISDDVMYFHPLASNEEFSVRLDDLKRSQFGLDFSKIKKIGNRISQSAAQTVDKNGVVFFGVIGETSIGCWNTKNKKNVYNLHTVETYLERNFEKLQFPSGMKVVEFKNEQELWVSTCRFQKVFNGNLNENETNFRILRVNVDDYVRDTKCEATFDYNYRNKIGEKSKFRPSYLGNRGPTIEKCSYKCRNFHCNNNY